MNVKQCLIESKKLIQNNGWCQHAYTDGVGYCLAGSIAASKADDSTCQKAYQLLCKLVDNGNAYMWNDEPGRTVNQVIDLFDRAIRKC